MSAYDGAGRLKTGARMRAPSVGARTRSKQRKWRVLLSIGLLLPALAALIGIVAWAISVEVANSAAASNRLAASSSQASHSSSGSRKQIHKVQYQQFRRHLPSATNGEHATTAQLAASGAAFPSRPLEPQSPNSIVEPVAAAVISSGGKSTGQTGAVPGSSRRRSASGGEGRSPATSNRLQPARATEPAAERQTAKKAAKKAASLDDSDEGGGRSTLLLTHLGQLGELSGSGASDADDTTTVAIAAQSQTINNKNSYQTFISPSAGSAASSLMPARQSDDHYADGDDSGEMATAKEGGDEADGSLTNHASYSPAVADGKSNRDATATSSEDERASASDSSSKGAMEQRSSQQQGTGLMLMASAKNVNHKSRLLSEQKQKQLQQLHKQTTEQSTDVSSSQKSPATTATAATKPTKAGRFNSRFHRHHFHIEHSASAPSASALAAVGASSASPMQSRDTAVSAEMAQVQDDEEVSFEAIASAISNTLTSANGSQQQPSQPQPAQPQSFGGGFDQTLRSLLPAEQLTEGDTGLLPGVLMAPNEHQATAKDPLASPGLLAGSDGPAAVSMFQRRLVPVKRRTTGEHVAEVIDHIVERRKRTNVSGPQIVVVAPVGGGASMKARSLTKASADSDDKRPSNIKTPKKPATPTSSDSNKRSAKKAETSTPSTAAAAEKKQAKPAAKSSKPIGARLLGTKSAVDSQQGSYNADKFKKNGGQPRSATIDYSERVEVIEDDDSSPLLVKRGSPLAKEGQLSKANEDGADDRSSRADFEPLEPEQEERDAADMAMLLPEDDQLNADEDEEEPESSIHISSHSSEPKSRWPRHEISASQTLERYVPLQRSSDHQASSNSQLQARASLSSSSTDSSSSNNDSPSQPKLYSAEQLIREHVLKSKMKPKAAAAASPPPPPPPSQQQQRSQKTLTDSGDNNKARTSQSQALSRPQIIGGNGQPASPAIVQGQGQQQPQLESLLSLQQQLQKLQPAQQVKMIPTTIRPHLQDGNRQQQQQEPKELSGEGLPSRAELNAFGSSIRSVQVPLFIHQRPVEGPTNAQAPLAAGVGAPAGKQQQQQLQPQLQDTYQTMESQPQPSIVNFQQQQAQAHLASQEQAFSQHQQKLSPQPNLHHHLQNHQLQQQQQLQQQPQQAIAMTASSLQQTSQSAPLPVFADQVYNVPAHMAESVIQEIQRTPPQIGMVNGQPTLLSSTVGGQVPRQQHQLRHHSPQQQQLMHVAASQQNPVYLMASLPSQHQVWNQMAAANLMAARMSTQQQQQYQYQQQQQQLQQQRHVLANRNSVEAAPVSVSVKSPMALVQPVAQMALRHLFSSLGQQQQSVAPAAASAAPPHTGAAALQASKASQVSQESILSAGSEPTASAALAPSSMEPMGGRSMRSLPSGPPTPPSASQQPGARELPTSGDQEVAESYGQMPAYHIGGGGYGAGPQYYGGGGGEGGYQSDNDKKSKGITFHFGGGPIGGGTQLITSPMGIFKHLMIPLLPNPRVNLNGKVVFGVVLEKSTAIGEPKKRYKFWG